MISTYTAKYTKVSSGYMGQLVEWPEVITEEKTLGECRELLQDAVREMVIAYRQQNKEVPVGIAGSFSCHSEERSDEESKADA